jgi:putative peptide zinc metalloprotease protein
MLASIRDDLDLHRSSSTAEGHPTWVIHDPARNKFYQIEWRVFEVLRRWEYGSAELIAKAVNRETTFNITDKFVEQVGSFLSVHQLVRVIDSQGTKLLTDINEKAKKTWWSWALHNYLFFRIPLFKPDHFLTLALPFVRFLYSKFVFWLILICLFSGLYLLVKQWDVYIGQLIDFFSIRGIFFFGVALLIAKIAHEFGHAFTAKLYGCRVPAMGVAFLVLWPMLYTDTNESWKLGSRRKRLNIAAAGVIVELGIAAFATLAWSLLPPGSIKDMAFVMSTTTWVTTLAINFSPFMRFDGYYLLSDLWGIPNLHERSFRLAKWWLREKLFDLNEPVPEVFSKRRTSSLIIFAFSVWIYRLILFLGIAVLVYHFFIKIIGIFLFITEISWFILRPIWMELKEWHARGKFILVNKRIWIWIMFFGLVLTALFLPWRNSVTTDAVLKAKTYSIVYLKTAGRLENLMFSPGQEVKRGQLLARLTNPKLTFQLKQTENQIYAKKELQKLASLDADFRKQRVIIASELVRLRTERRALQEQLIDLNVKTPIDGNITDISPDITLGQWLGVGQKLAFVKGTSGSKITGYLNEEDIFRIHKSGACRFFILGSYRDPYTCRIVNVGNSAERILEDAMLASKYGGNISASLVGNKLVPDNAIYKIDAIVEGKNVLIGRQAIGILKVDADKISLMERFWRWFAAVLIRESGL